MLVALASSAFLSSCGRTLPALDGRRLIAPLSGSTVTSTRPTLHWYLPDGNPGAHVQLCHDPACSRPFDDFEVYGTSAPVGFDLSPGTYFWRVRTLTVLPTSNDWSATWEFTVAAHSPFVARPHPIDTSWGAELDVNRDGFADVAISSGDGHVFVYMGGPDGLSDTPAAALPTPREDVVASAGDVNGDGFADLLVGGPDEDGRPYTGTVLLFEGSATGIATTPTTTLHAPQFADGFGETVANAGDVNHDGYGDVLVGVPGYYRALPNDGTGRVFVYLGSAAGLGTSPAEVLAGSTPAGNFGTSVTSAGDVNGDGFPDVAVADAGSARGYLFLGSASGLVLSPASVFIDPMGPQGDTIVAGAGDVNGDGFADLVFKSSDLAQLYMGIANGLSATPTASLMCTTIAGAGDVNGDGYADVIASVGTFPDPFGHVGVFFGGASGLDTTPGITRAGVSPDTGFGVVVAGAGDVNGDQRADVLITSEIDGVAGRVSLFLGEMFSQSMNPDQTFVAPDGAALFGDFIASRLGYLTDALATCAAHPPRRRARGIRVPSSPASPRPSQHSPNARRAGFAVPPDTHGRRHADP